MTERDIANLPELQNLSEEESRAVMSIVSDLVEKGTSESYDNLLYRDYEEIPVSIHEFLHQPQYLGKGLTTKGGKFTLFPYWEKTLEKIFPDPFAPAAYNTVALTGAIGLGKSTVAIITGLYEMYRLLCLKDPSDYFGLMPDEVIGFALMNITLEAVKKVAWSKCMQLLKSSSWFMEKGSITGTTNEVWRAKKPIELSMGSQADHILGRLIYWCVDGNTIIATEKGDVKIKDCVDREMRVFSRDNDGNIVLSDPCTVKPTIKTKEEYRIELEDGSIIKCTADHRFMLKDGAYKEAQYLTEDDKLMCVSSLGGHYAGTEIKSVKGVELDEEKQYYDVINANPYNNFLIKTNNGYIGSHNCFLDEISFQPTQDVNKQKEKAQAIVDAAATRLQSRFMKGDKDPTLMVLASSKRTEQSFLEEWIVRQKETARTMGKDTVLVIDEPQWVIRDDKISGEWFKVAVGNKFLANEMIPDDATDEDVKKYVERGYSILEVPSGYHKTFVDNIDTAIMNIAGISTTSINRFLSGPRITEVRDKTYKNLFMFDEIEVGNAKDDNTQYYDYIDLSRLTPDEKALPLYVHMDLSVSGDKTGIAGVWVTGKKPPQPGQPETQDLYYKVAFCVSVKAPKGYQISFEKNRQFIYWLREQGFSVRGVSTDSFQSSDTGQILGDHGFKYSMISMDRVNPTSHVCEPYQYLKNTIYEERLKVFYDGADILIKEWTELERDNNSGRIDHPQMGSKDASDAVCLWAGTSIKLLSDDEKTIEELYREYIENGDSFSEWVSAYDTESSKVVSLPICGVVDNGYRDELTQLDLSNGQTLICTPDHLLLTQKGDYVEAQKSLNIALTPYGTNEAIFVESIKKAGGGEVYDLQLDRIHNFALSCGIFVHNCGALFNASRHADEYAFEYGERIDAMLEADRPDMDDEVDKMLSEDDWALIRNMTAPDDQKQQPQTQRNGHRVAQPVSTRVTRIRNPNEHTIPTSGEGAGRSFVNNDDDFIIL